MVNGPWIARDLDFDGCTYTADADAEIPADSLNFNALYCGRPATHDVHATDGHIYHVCLEHTGHALSPEMRPYLVSLTLRSEPIGG